MSATATPAPVKVIETKTFVSVDAANNNNKMWKYERLSGLVTEPGKKGVMETGDIRYTWSRVGAANPESTLKMYSEKDLAAILRSKTNRKVAPYNEVVTVGNTSAMGTSGKAVAKSDVARIAVREIAGSCQVTATLVKKLAAANKHEILAASGGQMDVDLETGIVRTPVGVVTLDAVKSARTKLDVMSPFIKRNATDTPAYMQLIEDYLRLVPQKTAFKRGWHVNFIDPIQQSSLLDQLEASVELAEQRYSAASSTDVQKIAAIFNVSMKVVDDTKIWDRMKKMYYDTRKSGHSCAHLNPVRMYEVNLPHMSSAFEADGRKLGNVKTLWHGTRVFNVLSILKRGFVLPNQLSTVQTTGAMYGPGLYFSENSTKSLNYSYGYWDGGSRDSNCYMFMVDVAMGREYVPTRSGNGKMSGFDSCHAIAGRSGVMNDEQIVYRTSQANIKYLVEFAA